MDVILYRRIGWNDPRLKHDKVGFSTLRKAVSDQNPMSFQANDVLSRADDVLHQIWTPDLFYPNSVQPSRVIDKGFSSESSHRATFYGVSFRGSR